MKDLKCFTISIHFLALQYFPFSIRKIHLQRMEIAYLM